MAQVAVIFRKRATDYRALLRKMRALNETGIRDRVKHFNVRAYIHIHFHQTKERKTSPKRDWYSRNTLTSAADVQPITFWVSFFQFPISIDDLVLYVFFTTFRWKETKEIEIGDWDWRLRWNDAPNATDCTGMYILRAQGGEDLYAASSCRSLFAKEPLITGLFCRK